MLIPYLRKSWMPSALKAPFSIAYFIFLAFMAAIAG